MALRLGHGDAIAYFSSPSRRPRPIRRLAWKSRNASRCSVSTSSSTPIKCSGRRTEQYQAGEPVVVTGAVPDYPTRRRIDRRKQSRYSLRRRQGLLRSARARRFVAEPFGQATTSSCRPRNDIRRLGAFYETALHELSHWSGDSNRLGSRQATWLCPWRIGSGNFRLLSWRPSWVCLRAKALENHVAYLKSWLKDMRDDPSYIFKASTQAIEGHRFPAVVCSSGRSRKPKRKRKPWLV